MDADRPAAGSRRRHHQGRVKRVRWDGGEDDPVKRREQLVARFEKKAAAYRTESGRDNPSSEAVTQIPTLLRGDDKHSLPYEVVEQIWLEVLFDPAYANFTALDAMSLARGLRPHHAIPRHPRFAEIETELASMTDADGRISTPVADFKTGRIYTMAERQAAFWIKRERYQQLQDEYTDLSEYVESAEYKVRARRAHAGIPELARVLATNQLLWRVWWFNYFPCQVRPHSLVAFAHPFRSPSASLLR